MSSNKYKAERKAEKERQYELEYSARLAEEVRKDALTMWARIEEAKVDDDVKDILHRLAEKLGM